MSPSSTVKTIVVTGATAGIGLEAALQLAAQGHRLVLVGRSPEKLARAAERVEAAGAAGVDTFVADFASLDSVRGLAAELRSRLDRIDVLVNNAGGVHDKRTLTADGLEATFAVNHLAGFLLTELVKDRVVAAAPARIVFTSSDGHYSGTMDFDDLGFERGYTIMKAYGRSKLANVLYARRLAAELADAGVTVNALHPGAVATDIWSGAPWFARPVLAVAKRFMRSPADGGRRSPSWRPIRRSRAGPAAATTTTCSRSPRSSHRTTRSPRGCGEQHSRGVGRMTRAALLVLEDGRTFHGESYGADGGNLRRGGVQHRHDRLPGDADGPVVPPPGSGHDRSPHRQHRRQRRRRRAAGSGWPGYVVRDPARVPSNWRSRRSLDDELRAQGVVGISGIDTRALTRHLRDRGAMRVGISSTEVDPAALLTRVKGAAQMLGADLSSEVSTVRAVCRAGAPWGSGGEEALHRRGVDLGIKTMTPTRMAERGIEVHVVPAAATLDDVLAVQARRTVLLQRSR